MSIRSIFSKTLPFITAAMTGGTSLVAKMALDQVGKALNVPAPATVDDAMTLMSKVDPSQIPALQQAEQDFQVKMKQLDIQDAEELARISLEGEKVAAADRADARQREIKTGDSWTTRVIAAVFIAGYFAIQIFLLGHVIPAEMREIIMRTLGTLDMGLGLILGYYFGSSAGSNAKNQMIAAKDAMLDRLWIAKAA